MASARTLYGHELESQTGELLIRLGRLDSARRAEFAALLSSWRLLCTRMALAGRDEAFAPCLALLFPGWDFEVLRELAAIVEPQMDVTWPQEVA